MARARNIRKQAYLDKTRAELGELERMGLVCSGYAFASVLFVKGELSDVERAGEELLSGADGRALYAALTRLGYAPEDWACIAPSTAAGEPLTAEQLREAIAVLDPSSVVCLDGSAAQAIRTTFSEELAELEDFDAAMLEEGVVASVLGMRFMYIGEFAASLEDDRAKQLMWARLKTLPPLGEPF